eukprot:XP_028336381.1 uncharacterized protein LOC114484429 [Physeter catodon]
MLTAQENKDTVSDSTEEVRITPRSPAWASGFTATPATESGARGVWWGGDAPALGTHGFSWRGSSTGLSREEAVGQRSQTGQSSGGAAGAPCPQHVAGKWSLRSQHDGQHRAGRGRPGSSLWGAPHRRAGRGELRARETRGHQASGAPAAAGPLSPSPPWRWAGAASPQRWRILPEALTVLLRATEGRTAKPPPALRGARNERTRSSSPRTLPLGSGPTRTIQDGLISSLSFDSICSNLFPDKLIVSGSGWS